MIGLISLAFVVSNIFFCLGHLYAFPATMKAAIFLERDGILNHARADKGQQMAPLTLDEFKVNKSAVRPLRQLKDAGFLLIATTNQQDISRGTLSRRDLDRMHELLTHMLDLDDIFVCPHDQSDGCPCRKPRPGLFTEAAFKWHLDLDRCFVVSDKWQDAEAARQVGCTSLIVQSPWVGRVHHDFLLPDLASAVRKISQVQSALWPFPKRLRTRSAERRPVQVDPALVA
jgi:D-glycero-D-manno-heptose 1,7-bisphosphate phosphatase